VFLEPWALATYAAALAEDPQIRMWLPPCPMPHYVLAGELLQRPGMPAIELTPEQAAAVALCDGTMPAAKITRSLGLSEQDGTGLLTDLVRRKITRWDANLPVSPHTEALLERRNRRDRTNRPAINGRRTA